jgi:hypothetical protein
MHLRLFYLGFGLVTLAAVVARAQAPTGAIAGTVTDETGGVVIGASVTVINKSTGLKRERRRRVSAKPSATRKSSPAAPPPSTCR